MEVVVLPINEIMASDPIRELAERSARRKKSPELAAIDAKIEEGYARESGEDRKFTTYERLITRIFVGGIMLIMVFFVCLWITDYLRARHDRELMHEGVEAANEAVKKVIGK